MKQRIELFLGDITTLKVDAIVNAANRSLLGGGGVDGAIHSAAGPKLLEECRSLNGCETGEAKITKGYNLPAKYVIHTVGPVYFSLQKNKEQMLSNCYFNSMKLAAQYGVKSIAFPCISTGVYAFPAEQAAEIALRSVRLSLMRYPKIERVIFCCYLQRDYDIYQKEYPKNQ